MSRFNNQRSPLSAGLMGSAAAAALLALSATGAQAAAAAAAPAEVEQIVVTGTSIRGVAPVGSNVITVDRAEIQKTGAQTVQQLLSGVPQVTGFNNVAQGSFGSADGSGTNAPTIHSLGASASNGTLVLVDGHRLPLSGLNHTLADPSVIPPSAIERVEVLPDGSSAVYGSDAVAGVLNFITRRRYNGLETSAQYGFGDKYHTANFNMVAGNTWDGGSALIAYGYSYRSSLKNGDRDFYQTDLRAKGGTNFNNFNCSPAAVQAGASGGSTFFLAPYTGAAVSNANGACNYSYDTDMVPEEMRHSVLMKIEQKLGERLTLSADLVYSQRTNKQQNTVGSVSNVVVYGPGSAGPGGPGQINPFFTGPAGTNVERVNWAADELFPNSKNKAGAETKFVTLGAEYDLGHDWVANFGGTFGQDDSYSKNYGVLCASCAILALNGTTNVAGNPLTPSIPSTLGNSLFLTRFPLTTANAIDVWNTGSANRTSAAVLNGLLDNTISLSKQNIENVKFTVGGPAFELPGGAVRVSVGAEGVRYSLRQNNTQTANAGPVSTNAQYTSLDYSRQVYAFFGETVVPVIGPNNELPFIKKLDLSAAVRYDHYDDFGSTTNPKFAATLEVIDGLSFRGSYGTSFTAPALTSRGNEFGITGESAFGVSGQQTIPGAFPGAQSLPGCGATPTTGGCNIGGNNPAQGIQVNGGNANLKPQTGDSHSFGVDWRPSFVRGFRLSATYWAAKYQGLVTAPNFGQVVASPGLYDALILNPTAAQIAAATNGLRQTSALPTQINFIYSFQQRNVSNLDASGIDLDMRYRFSSGFGDWNLGLASSYKLKFTQQYGSGTPYLSRLNTSGLNTTFSSLRFTGRATIGWDLDNWSANMFVNYTNGYWNRNSNATAINGPRGQRVSSYTTIDAHLSYTIQADGWLKETEVFVDAKNLFDQHPPFVNVSGGFSTADSNPIGRVATVGIRKKW